MKITNKLVYQEFINREENFVRADYNTELIFYESVKKGDVDFIYKFCQKPFAELPGFGKLSNNSLQNLKYHFAITAALVSRYCIEGGMNISEAYNLSDFYILSVDESTSVEEISVFHQKMCVDYAIKMKNIQKKNQFSKPIIDCVNFIFDNLHRRITLQELSSFAKLSPSYLSKLFSKEVGISISNYILNKKIETAEKMLCYSEYSVFEISEILAFANQAHFTYAFKKKNGITPSQFRIENYRKLKI